MKLWSTLTEPLENSILLSAQASLMYKLRSRVKVSGWTWLSNDDDRVETETMFTKAGFGNDYNLKYIDKDDRCVDNDWALGGRQVHLVVIFWQTDRAWTDLEISNVRHIFFSYPVSKGPLDGGESVKQEKEKSKESGHLESFSTSAQLLYNSQANRKKNTDKIQKKNI